MRRLLLLAFLLPAALAASAQFCLPGRFGVDDTIFSRSDVGLAMDVVYGHAPDWLGRTDTLRLDLWGPRADRDPLALRPLLINLHGGGFRGGSKSSQKSRFWAEGFARRGYVVASLDYRLGWPFEDSCSADTTLYMEALWRATQDVRAAWRFLADTADALRVDTSAVFVLGASAGSACGLAAVYARETDFAPYLESRLGPLDGSGNDRPRRAFRPKGIVTKSAGLEGLYALARHDAPHLMFHGTCDLTVPFTEGPLFHCWAPERFVYTFGSGRLAEAYSAEGRCHTLYATIGQGHGATEDDTVLVYGARFLDALLCDSCALPERIDRATNLNVCANRADTRTRVEWVFPSPGDGLLNVVLAGPRDDELFVELVDRTGRVHYRERRAFTAPVANWAFDFRGLAPGVYFLTAGVRDRVSAYPVVIAPR